MLAKLPLRVRIHSLSTRIALVFACLILVVQTAGYGVIERVIRSSAQGHAEESLSVGQRVFDQVLKNNREKLRQAASVVAADFAFRSAVASHDRPTIESALENHGNRVGATVVMLLGLDGTLQADTRDPAATGHPLADAGLLRAAERSGTASSVGVVDGHPNLLVAVPVKAPVVIAWIVMGIAIDDVLAGEIRDLISLDVSFVGREADTWRILASSLPAPAQQDLTAALAGRSGVTDPIDTPTTLTVADVDYGVQWAPLVSGEQPVRVLLQRSLREAMAPFQPLRSALLMLGIAGMLIGVVGSLLTARTVTRPIAELTRHARRIGRGDEVQPVRVEHDDEVGELAQAFNQMRDDLADREHRITDLAYKDGLTGLPNRALFNDRLQQAISVATRLGHPLAVLMMDLDRFKLVNDTLGHHLGDLLLCEVGRRLEGELARSSDTVARLGGDEFAVLLPTQGEDAARAVARRLLKTLEAPIDVEGQMVDVSASIGIVTCPDDGDDIHTLLRRADIAMYAAKHTSAGFCQYSAELDTHSSERLSLLSELREAVEHDQLTLYYQPKVDLASGAVRHVEALVRWHHPTRGFIPPDQFIPFAEQIGYIKHISRWVAEQAVRQAASWQQAGLDLAVSINVSARDLIGADLPEFLEGLLARHRLAPSRLWVEITESALMDEPEQAIDTMMRLRRLGLRMSIDDFGTGYSSLTYLKRMPVDELKIDQSFVRGMTRDKDDETIVRSTIDLGHNMGLKVVAEGVEDEAILLRLKAMNSDLVQGYHVSRPLPADKLEAWLADWAARGAAAAESAVGNVSIC